MTTIQITSDNTVEEILIEDLKGNIVAGQNGGNFNLSNNWYLLKVPYNGIKTEISDIQINGVSVIHMLYTGWFENNQGTRFQPATAMWEPGYFMFWFYPNVGHMVSELMQQIHNGDFGTNLFEKYTLTVDRPVDIPEQFPGILRDYFGHGTGPKWWSDSTTPCPYKVLEGDIFNSIAEDLPKFISSMERPLNLCDSGSINWAVNSWNGTTGECSDFASFDETTFDGFGKYFKEIGFTNLLTCSHSVLGAGGSIELHVDDFANSKNKPYINGRTKLYYCYNNSENTLFKITGVGCLPLDKPLLIDTNNYSHAVVNLSNSDRHSITAYGTFDKVDESYERSH